MAIPSGGVAVIAAATLVVGGGAGFLLGRDSNDPGGPRQIPVVTASAEVVPKTPGFPATPGRETARLPDFTGLTAAAAQDMLLFAGWDPAEYHMIGAPSASITGYRVTKQFPAAGSSIAIHSVVTLVIAK
jgi:hypothetical protein